ncbi:SUMF1/EgtB/PvdO family nonheme iron enzyme, partial [Rubripirellula sp.]|nr:SUMF1/EgtB/PvdO family nonheme iron enzyme [Rubripirellula sp.]
LKLIPPGKFVTKASNEDKNGTRAHQVTLTNAFRLGAQEVTQLQYFQVMGANPSHFQGPSNPVEQVSWHSAVEFCRKLSELPEEQAKGHVYRLPTEAEWEYACRAGTTTNYSFGDEESYLSEYAWYGRNADGTTHPVAEKSPNAWGLFDMHGNVFEWCMDWYGDYPSESVTNPMGPQSGLSRVDRGGSWDKVALDCLSSRRGRLPPSKAVRVTGFRVVCIIAQSGVRLGGAAPHATTSSTSSERDHDDPGDFGLSPEPNILSQAPDLAVAPLNPEQAKNSQEAWARHLGVPVEIENSIGMKFRLIPSGIYEKATNLDEKSINSFYLAKCEVRQHMYQQIMGSNPSIRGNRGWTRPVTSITWNDASSFCSKLSQKEQRVYRLPRSNELEFAGLAGSLSNYSFGDDIGQIGQYAWFNANAGSGSRNVGTKLPNAWGLFDMHGNVQEWRSDPVGLKRYIGGGSWRYPATHCGLGPNARNPIALGTRSHNVGFRVLLELRRADQPELTLPP